MEELYIRYSYIPSGCEQELYDNIRIGIKTDQEPLDKLNEIFHLFNDFCIKNRLSNARIERVSSVC